MSEAVKTLLAPGCKLDAMSEIADPFDMDAIDIGTLLLKLLEHLDLVPVKVRHMEGGGHHYEIEKLQRAGERYFSHRADMRRGPDHHDY